MRLELSPSSRFEDHTKMIAFARAVVLATSVIVYNTMMFFLSARFLRQGLQFFYEIVTPCGE